MIRPPWVGDSVSFADFIATTGIKSIKSAYGGCKVESLVVC